MIDGHRVFDAHLHVQPWEMVAAPVRAMLEAERGPDAERILRIQRDPAALLEYLDAQGVDRAVLVNYVAPDVTGFTEGVNAWVGRIAAAAPDRLVAMGGLHPRRMPDAGEEAAAKEVDAVLAAGVRAFKLHPSHQWVDPLAYQEETPSGRNLAGIYRALERRGVPLTVHTGTSVFPNARNRFADPMRLDDVAVDFPRLTLVLAHAGRPLWTDAAAFLARRHPNVHLDLSGIPPRSLLRYLPRLEDLAPKSMFGSDWPGPGVPGPRANAEAFLRLEVSEKAKRAMLWENATRVFG